ncbi:MAG TPA: hypothetical protein VN903_30745, partial [Polyangia bacterium]|nr:hypothetical protein [Polyangia bacterium]
PASTAGGVVDVGSLPGIGSVEVGSLAGGSVSVAGPPPLPGPVQLPAPIAHASDTQAIKRRFMTA